MRGTETKTTQAMYVNVTSRRVHVLIVAMEKQFLLHILGACL